MGSPPFCVRPWVYVRKKVAYLWLTKKQREFNRPFFRGKLNGEINATNIKMRQLVAILPSKNSTWFSFLKKMFQKNFIYVYSMQSDFQVR